MTEDEGAVVCNDMNPFSFRLHVLRHAETVANKAGIVLGQFDSPLTELGVKQAMAAHNEYGTNNYWKVFSSDLERCRKTSWLILFGTEIKDSDDAIQSGIHLDSRLRERSKGAREGQCKHLSYSEALALWEKRKESKGESCKDSVPFLESEEEVLERFQKWLEETICAAYADYCSMKQCVCGEYNVLAISHSGTLRTVFEKMIGNQLPCDAEREDESGKSGRLVIPNTSKTIIEFTAVNESSTTADEVRVVTLGEGSNPKFWRPRLLEYTNTAHFQKI
eukprot:scaffold2884_cov267-Chaetoceros_neogracile.AAC.13